MFLITAIRLLRLPLVNDGRCIDARRTTSMMLAYDFPEPNGPRMKRWRASLCMNDEMTLIYNVQHEEALGPMIALYFFMTGLSAGSFILSTLAYGFGIKK